MALRSFKHHNAATVNFSDKGGDYKKCKFPSLLIRLPSLLQCNNQLSVSLTLNQVHVLQPTIILHQWKVSWRSRNAPFVIYGSCRHATLAYLRDWILSYERTLIPTVTVLAAATTSKLSVRSAVVNRVCLFYSTDHAAGSSSGWGGRYASRTDDQLQNLLVVYKKRCSVTVGGAAPQWWAYHAFLIVMSCSPQ